MSTMTMVSMYRTTSIYGACKDEVALPLSGQELLQLTRIPHPTLGHKPDTVELARLLGVHESQVANAIVEARHDEWLKRKTNAADWERAAPRDPRRVALIRPKLAADAASREPAKITLPRLRFLEEEA